MNQHEGNPVGRLYLVLDHFSSRSDTTTNLTVLAGYMSVPPQVSPQLLAGLSALMNLPGEARAAFGRSGTDAVPFEEVVAEIDKASNAILASTALSSSCLEVKRHFDRGTLVALSYASRAVGSIESAPTLDTQERSSIREAAEALIQAVRLDENLAAEAKRILIEHAEAVLHALNLVDIIGVDALVKERDRLEGHIRRQPHSFAEALRRHKVGAALIALNLALHAVGGAVNDVEAISKGVGEVYELIINDSSSLTPSAPKELERGKDSADGPEAPSS